jgi:hypothetical protein
VRLLTFLFLEDPTNPIMLGRSRIAFTNSIKKTLVKTDSSEAAAIVASDSQRDYNYII